MYKASSIDENEARGADFHFPTGINCKYEVSELELEVWILVFRIIIVYLSTGRKFSWIRFFK